MLKFGYISNGFADHTVEQMATVLQRTGYDALGLTVGPPHLDPFHASRAPLAEIRHTLEAKELGVAIETGARYVLDPFRKHRPSLVSIDAPAREQRAAYYVRAIDIAAELGARVVSIWSGTPQPGVSPDATWTRLTRALEPLLDRAAEKGVTIAFEPEPGMFVEDLAGWDELKRRLPHPALGLTIDVGHLAVTEERPWAAHLERYAEDLVHVHLDDTRDGIHEHLPLGAGEIDWDDVLSALTRIDYRGLALVELSRHSHVAPLMAQRSLLFLRAHEARARLRGGGGTEDEGSRREGDPGR